MPELLVYSDWHGARGPRLLGTLVAETVRGRESFAFSFDEARLRDRGDLAVLDPELSLWSGRQYPARGNFGLFLDSCPDRWGRRLIRRREALRADAVAHEDAVRHAGHRQPEAAEERGHKKAPERTSNKVPAFLQTDLFRRFCHVYVSLPKYRCIYIA